MRSFDTMQSADPPHDDETSCIGSCIEPCRPTVLVVDDDRDLLAALRFSLEADGYRVRAFESAEALLATEAEHGQAVSCLVIDYVLPKANGLDLVRALRLRGIAAPTILITTHPTVRVREATASLGVRILEKPLLGGMLAQAVREEVARTRG